MRKIKKLVAVATLSIMAFSLAGCNMIQKTPEAIQKTVLAKIGNETITLADVNEELKADIEYLKQQYGEDFESNIDDTLKEQLKSARKQVLTQLVEDKVVIAKGADLLPAQEELDAAIAEEKENFKEIYGGEDGLKQALEYYGMTEESFNAFVETTVKKDKIKEAITKDITVTDEEISKYYDENIAKYTKKPGANAQHILFETEDEAKAALEEIKASSFDEVFAKYKGNSEVPLAEDLGYVENEQENFDKDFLAGFVNLKTEDQISEPIKSSFGYHIIQVKGIVTEEVVTPLEDAKDSIKTSLESTKKSEAWTSKIEEWEKELKVKTYEDKL